MKYINILITIDPMTTIPKTIPEYELAVLKAMYPDIEEVDTFQKKLKNETNAANAYRQLFNKYGMKKEGSPVEDAYGKLNSGMFQKAFDSAYGKKLKKVA